MAEREKEKVWWAVPGSAYVKMIDIKPYFADVDLENDRLQDMAQMEHSLGSYEPYPSELIPEELRWYQRVVTDNDRNLPDAFKGHAAESPVVSEAMRDELADFDLGTSQFFECPLYDIKASDKQGRTEADRSKQDPRRWFLFHVSDTKQALDLEHSTDLYEAPYQPGVYRPYEDQDPTIAINRNVALKGPLIWRDPNLLDVFFFNDAIKRAIMAKGMRTPSFKFKPCLLA